MTNVDEAVKYVIGAISRLTGASARAGLTENKLISNKLAIVKYFIWFVGGQSVNLVSSFSVRLGQWLRCSYRISNGQRTEIQLYQHLMHKTTVLRVALGTTCVRCYIAEYQS